MLLLVACAPSLSIGDTAPADTATPTDADTDTDTDTDSDTDADTDADTDTDSDTDTDTDTDSDAAWAAFVDGTDDALRALAVPILACVARDDNTHAVFDGCYDWHSAVHGHWALLVVSRLLDDPSYAEAAAVNFTEEDLARELTAIAEDDLYEVPYGYAWFLLLADERAAQGEGDLEPLGEAAAAVLDAHISGLGPGAARNAALADDYENLSWAVLNLWRWYVSHGDAEGQARLEDVTRDLLVPLDAECPLEDDLTDADNFFPACLMRAHTILSVLPPEEVDAWLLGVLPADYPIAPVTSITSAHVSGLNFSRNWGLWSLYTATGDTQFRDAVRAHVEWQLDHPEYWAANYDAYSHWVPQFGVYVYAEME